MDIPTAEQAKKDSIINKKKKDEEIYLFQSLDVPLKIKNAISKGFNFVNYGCYSQLSPDIKKELVQKGYSIDDDSRINWL